MDDSYNDYVRKVYKNIGFIIISILSGLPFFIFSNNFLNIQTFHDPYEIYVIINIGILIPVFIFILFKPFYSKKGLKHLNTLILMFIIFIYFFTFWFFIDYLFSENLEWIIIFIIPMYLIFLHFYMNIDTYSLGIPGTVHERIFTFEEESFRVGGMSILKFAHDNNNPKSKYIAKIPRGDGPNKYETCLEKLLLESEVLKQCDHRNIVRYVDSFERGSEYYLVLEYVDGSNLDELYSRDESANVEPLDEQRIRYYTLELLEALDYFHDNIGYIHRDINPTNIMIRSNGDLVLIDFGTIKKRESALSYFEEGSIEWEEPKKGTIIYTKGYASPEQELYGVSHIQSDIYSVGSVIYFLATGHVPQYFQRMRHMPLGPFPEIPPSLGFSDELINIVKIATDNDPKNRYQSAREMIIALQGGSIVDRYSSFAMDPYDSFKPPDHSNIPSPSYHTPDPRSVPVAISPIPDPAQMIIPDTFSSNIPDPAQNGYIDYSSHIPDPSQLSTTDHDLSYIPDPSQVSDFDLISGHSPDQHLMTPDPLPSPTIPLTDGLVINSDHKIMTMHDSLNNSFDEVTPILSSMVYSEEIVQDKDSDPSHHSAGIPRDEDSEIILDENPSEFVLVPVQNDKEILENDEYDADDSDFIDVLVEVDSSDELKDTSPSHIRLISEGPVENHHGDPNFIDMYSGNRPIQEHLGLQKMESVLNIDMDAIINFGHMQIKVKPPIIIGKEANDSGVISLNDPENLLRDKHLLVSKMDDVFKLKSCEPDTCFYTLQKDGYWEIFEWFPRDGEWFALGYINDENRPYYPFQFKLKECSDETI